MKSMVCITGATGGLGKAFSVECASRGWDLFLTDISETALRRLSESLVNTYGIDVHYYSCDLTDAESRTMLFEYLNAHGRKYNFLINVAGLDFEGVFAERTRSQIRTMLRLNIEANLEITHELLKMRDPARTFRIINVSSLAAFYPMPVKATYSSSKRFLLNFSRALGEELRSQDITVTALCPAGMPTTPECIEAIEAQGFAGRITTCNVGYVASKTIDMALRGKPVYIPGLLNRLLKAAGSMVPASLVARAVGSRWNAAQSRRRAGHGSSGTGSVREFAAGRS
jgi:short-subunit dehydrogenase